MTKKAKNENGTTRSVVAHDIKSNANDPYFLKKAEEAGKTLKRVGLPGQSKK